MARQIKQKSLEPILSAAEQWINRCLVQDRSILTDSSLWTAEAIAELQVAFVQNLKEGEGTFIRKLETQMAGASSAAQRLMAEMLWAALLFTVTHKAQTKREYIQRIWALSGDPFPENSPMLAESVLDGIGSGGTGFVTNLWRELIYLIGLTAKLKEASTEERTNVLKSYDALIGFMTSVPMQGQRQLRHMLRYFAFPDEVERMSSNSERRAVLTAFTRATPRELAGWSDRDLDAALLQLRQKLQSEYGDEILDFYESPLRERWKDEQHAAGAEEVLRRYLEEKVIFSSSSIGSRYAVQSCDNSGASIVRLDANEPQAVTFQRLATLIGRVKAAGSMDFAQLDNTSAIRNTALQAPELALSGDRSRVLYVAGRDTQLDCFLDVLGNLRTQSDYKPLMLLCVVEGIDSGELTENQITFDWIAPRFIDKAQSRGMDATEANAAFPFYHLTGDLFWLHAVYDVSNPMRDGRDGPGAARTRVKYAFLKDTYWDLLQDDASRGAVRERLKALLTPHPVEPRNNVSPNQLTSDALTAFNQAGFRVHRPMLQRFVCALASKPFVILTGLAGSGKTKLAQAFARWITAASGSADPFTVGAEIAAERKVYTVTAADSLSVEFRNPDGTLVMLPRALIREWADHIQVHELPKTTPVRTLREAVKAEERLKYSDQLHSFETHLKAAAFALLASESAPNVSPAYAVVAVGADWTGNENILGYPDGLDRERYVAKPALELLLNAQRNPRTPHFLILDEMNLSHVERYFADLLSAIESAEALHLHQDTARQASAHEVPARLKLPRNLFIVGTVNVDETTYMFSPKVLDRANVIEFRMDETELMHFLTAPAPVDLGSISGTGSDYGPVLVDLLAAEAAVPSHFAPQFQSEMPIFFNVLREHGAEFGFRVAQEASRFLHFWDLLGSENTNSEASFRDAFDCVILQKFLPKLHGSRARLAPLLKKLWFLCTVAPDARVENPLRMAEEAARSSEKQRDPQQAGLANAHYPLSAEKICRMWRLLNENGFTSFAEA